MIISNNVYLPRSLHTCTWVCANVHTLSLEPSEVNGWVRLGTNSFLLYRTVFIDVNVQLLKRINSPWQPHFPPTQGCLPWCPLSPIRKWGDLRMKWPAIWVAYWLLECSLYLPGKFPGRTFPWLPPAQLLLLSWGMWGGGIHEHYRVAWRPARGSLPERPVHLISTKWRFRKCSFCSKSKFSVSLTLLPLKDPK